MTKLLLPFLCYLSIITCCNAQTQSIFFNDKRIAYEGRIAFTNDAATLHWPGVSATIRFKGSSLLAELKDADTANYYNIIIDNRTIQRLHTDPQKRTYTLASGLPYGEHSVQIFKRTEWDKGKTFLYSFSSDEPIHWLKPIKKPARKIEFFGNSITCGYAIEDTVTDLSYGYFENNYDSYAAITARHFNAQYHCTAKSGIGITISWFPLTMDEMYNRLAPQDSNSKWNFKKYTPQLVIINLLQNDSWLVNMPEHDEFKRQFGSTKPSEEFIINAYQKFVKTIRNTYPKAQIICMLGNMDVSRENSPWPGYVEKAVTPLNDKNIFTFFVPYKGTDGHPKTAEQKQLAELLIKFIDEHIKW